MSLICDGIMLLLFILVVQFFIHVENVAWSLYVSVWLILQLTESQSEAVPGILGLQLKYIASSTEQ